MRFAYLVRGLEDADGVTVTWPDAAEMSTGGWGEVAANLETAGGALTRALSGGYVDAVEAALRALGRRLVVEVLELA